MLDWEFAHVGDPLDDLAWVAVRNQLVRAGLDVPSAFGAWREATGCELDPGRLEYYRALVLVRMLVSCDATVRWSGGVETDESRTQVMLRPLLAVHRSGPAPRRLRRPGSGRGRARRGGGVGDVTPRRRLRRRAILEDFGALR